MTTTKTLETLPADLNDDDGPGLEPERDLIVWGVGASTIDAIREADGSDAAENFAALHDAARWESLEKAKRVAGVEGGWCVAVRDYLVDESDLDADAAVRGYCRVPAR